MAEGEAQDQGVPRLRANRDFRLLWFRQRRLGAGVARLGHRLSAAGAGAHGSPADAGLAGFAATIPYLLWQLPGRRAGRPLWNRKVIMIACDAGRALALASIVLALALDSISLAQIIAVSSRRQPLRLPSWPSRRPSGTSCTSASTMLASAERAAGIAGDHDDLPVPAVDQRAGRELPQQVGDGGGEAGQAGIRRRARERQHQQRIGDGRGARPQHRDDAAEPEEPEVPVGRSRGTPWSCASPSAMPRFPRVLGGCQSVPEGGHLPVDSRVIKRTAQVQMNRGEMRPARPLDHGRPCFLRDFLDRLMDDRQEGRSAVIQTLSSNVSSEMDCGICRPRPDRTQRPHGEDMRRGEDSRGAVRFREYAPHRPLTVIPPCRPETTTRSCPDNPASCRASR